MNKRLQLLFLVLVVMTSVFIWRKPITSHAIKFGLKYFSERVLGEKVSFHDFQHKKNQLILFEPKLGLKSKALQKGGIYLEAELMTVQYQIDWWKRSLKFHFDLLNPKIQVVKTIEFKPSLTKLFKPSMTGLQIETSFKVQQGQLKLIDRTTSNLELSQHFLFEAESRNIQPDHVVASLSLSQDQSSCLGLISLKSGSIHYGFDLKEVKASELQDMINFWASNLAKEERSLNCLKGLINGVIDVSTSEEFMPVLQTQLEITGLALDDRKTLLAVHVPKADIHLLTNKIVKDKKGYSFKELLEVWIDASQGAIQIPLGAKVSYQKNQLEILKSLDMKGQITFNPKEPIKLHLEGNVSTGNRHSLLTIDGSGHFKVLKADLEVRMKNHFKDEARIRCRIDPSQEREHKLYVQLSHVSEDEADFIGQLLLPFYPQVKNFEIQKGHLDAHLIFNLKELKPQSMTVQDFQILGGYFNHCSGLEHIHNIRASGKLQLDFSQNDLLKTVQGELELQVEQMKAFGYSFEKIDGSFQILNGEIVQAQALTIFSGLKSQIDWLKIREIDPLQIRMKGLGKNFLAFSPSMINKSYNPWFGQESISCEIAGMIDRGSLNLKGKCSVGNYRPIFFGFNIHKRKVNHDANEQFRRFWQNFVIPIKTVPALSYFERKFNLHLTTKYTVQNGWFHIEEVPVEKFVSPIVFNDTSLTLQGRANIRGEFDQQGLSLSYDNFDLNLDHPTFTIFFKESERKKEGHHYFNFSTGSHFGNVYLENSHFLLKGNQMHFEKLSGSVEITPDYIYVPKLFSEIGNLQLSSNFKLRFSQQGDLDLKLKLDDFESQLSNLTSLFSSMGYTYLNQSPITGYLKIGREQAFFELNRRGEEVKTRVALGGYMIEGTIPFLAGQPLTDIKCKFNFDSQDPFFELKEFEGQWRSHRKQDYHLSSNYLKMNLFNDDPCYFDIKVTNSYKDCARLMGKMYLNVSQKKPILKIILDQKNNHIGSVDLTNVYFSLNESFQLDYLNVNFLSNLKSIQNDVVLIQNMMPQLSTTSVAAFHAMALEGDVSGQWVYDLKQKRHQFFIWGDQVKMNHSPSGFFQLKGYQEKNSVVIENFTYHDLKGEVSIEEKPFCYFVRGLKLKANQDLDISMSGIYCKIFNSFQADIHRIFCNLGNTKQLSLFAALPYFSSGQGRVDLKGKLEGGYFKGDFNYGLDFKGETTSLVVEPFLFKDDKVEGRIEGNSNVFKIAHIKGSFLSLYSKPLEVAILAKNIEFKKDMPMKIENMGFSFPVRQLPSLQAILKDHWQQELPTIASELKKDGFLEGHLHFDPADTNYYFNLQLKAGRYHLFNKDYDLDDCKLDYGPSGLQVKVQTSFEEKDYWIIYNKQSFKKNAFQLFILDQKPEVDLSKRLKIECQEEAEGFLIKNISGSVSGLRLDFVHRPEKDRPGFNVLMGQLQINGDQLIPSLSKNIQEKLVKLKLGKGYFLTGQLTLFKNDLKDFIFEGLFGGQNCELLGFEFKSLSSTIRYAKEQLEIKDFKLSDLSGELSADSIKFDKKQFVIPKIKLIDFKPSLLHSHKQGPLKHKPLIIDRVEISNLKGNLEDLNTIRGDGFLTFQKSPKKQTSLLDLPVHLISKLGLDLTMLNPVEGKVMFMVKDQKVIITKLIDVYSHDRHCHFTLAKPPELSYLNFDGSLNIKIKMKQYVLLKFTEPFIISVQGSYTTPRYSFMRKKVVVDVFENSSL